MCVFVFFNDFVVIMSVLRYALNKKLFKSKKECIRFYFLMTVLLISVDNAAHCDFNKLRQMLIR